MLAILEEWMATGRYENRVENIRTGTGPNLEATGIKLEQGTTVFDDGELDEIIGAHGKDWLFYDPIEALASDVGRTDTRN